MKASTFLVTLATAGIACAAVAPQIVRAQDENSETGKPITDEKAPSEYQFRGVVISPTEKYLVQPRKVGKRHVATLVVLKGEHRYTADDVAIRQPLYNGSVDTREPGESDGEYEFHLSPDERWLFVKRRSSNHLFYGTLYHRLKAMDTHFTLAQPNSARIDEAALRIYAGMHHLSPGKIGGGSRYTHFEKWDMKRGVLLFSVAAAPTFDADGKAWLAAYHFDTGKITIEKDEKY